MPRWRASVCQMVEPGWHFRWLLSPLQPCCPQLFWLGFRTAGLCRALPFLSFRVFRWERLLVLLVWADSDSPPALCCLCLFFPFPGFKSDSSTFSLSTFLLVHIFMTCFACHESRFFASVLMTSVTSFLWKTFRPSNTVWSVSIFLSSRLSSSVRVNLP